MTEKQEKREMMTIGQVARTVDVAATTLRYYEREGLLTPTARNAAGYRFYDSQAVERLEFIRSAQAVGFTLDDIRTLLQIEGQTPCKEVRELLQHRLSEVENKLAELQRVRDGLADALDRCRKSRRGCAVIAGINHRSPARRTTS